MRDVFSPDPEATRQPVKALINPAEWERWKVELPVRIPVSADFPLVGHLTVETREGIPVGRVVWLDQHDEVISVETLEGEAP